ncbi:MAG TPA: sn-glycerol-3-phosphate ABC transporter ATP-binding protein UgpC [Streptosporangiaceae bacterium]|jgi:multiple sugar transport system ATP-binding protein|nr:sn-glycerol-3-phosphate ABC transporter ATP-binding protein UgpC [Streptosporangiaceae bacterium]
MAEVRYENATCIYPGAERPAVDELALAIRDGEFVVMVGPSGCGKTTALRMLAGLEEIDDGSIRIDGQDMVGVPSRDRDIAMVFQNYALYPSKTVGENMGFALKMQGVSKEERARRVRDAAKLLDLEDFLDRKPRNLSGGQRQRVAMGRAIVREPKVFCMDEPLSNLDAQLRVATRTQIAEMQRRLAVTTVYVTHDQVEAMTMGERVAVMRAGKLQQFASPTELYDHPANVFVAGFIGSPAMNRLDGTLAPGHIKVGEASITPPDAMLRNAQGHGKLVVGVRPEHLSLGHDGEFTLEVELVEDLGSDSYVYGHLAGDKESKIIVRSGREHPKPGEVVKVAVDSTRLHLFDAVTGERVGE